jgi:uncharacterized Zn finger protein (UPF0148 family)
MSDRRIEVKECRECSNPFEDKGDGMDYCPRCEREAKATARARRER